MATTTVQLLPFWFPPANKATALTNTFNSVGPNSNVLIAAGASTSNTVQINNDSNCTGLVLVISITAASTATLQATLQGVTASGYTYTMLQSASLNSVSTTALSVGLGLTISSNVTANALLVPNMQLVVAITGTIAYGIDYMLSNYTA